VQDRSDRVRNRSPDPRRRLGSRAESLCAADIESRGWRIVERNWRIRIGEIDIVAVDGADLVIIEVKARSAGTRGGPTQPVFAVGRKKQRRLRMLAEAWLRGGTRRIRFDNVRFDVVGVTFDSAGNVASWQHIENAF